jgi:hexosaminidase
VAKDVTYIFVENVIREIAARTPGPYFHIGGDEAASTSPADYVQFVARAQTIVQGAGKRMIGWEEIGQAALLSSSIAQHWRGDGAAKAAAQHAHVIMSPASKAYLDMKYDASTPRGVSWAGFINEEVAYLWDPATEVPGVTESDLLGLEAPLWTETIETSADIDMMTFPRIAGYAEIGWSPVPAPGGRNWDEYRSRIASHGPRLTAMGVSFYKSSRIAWE